MGRKEREKEKERKEKKKKGRDKGKEEGRGPVCSPVIVCGLRMCTALSFSSSNSKKEEN